MSSFTAINIDSEKLDTQEHTRELQIEHALEVFDKALKAQKDGKFDEADSKYEDLFDINIISSSNVPHNPTIEQLKYLAFRNRGFLKMAELFKECEKDHENEDEQDEEVTNERYTKLVSAIVDLSSALAHGNADLKLITLVTDLCTFYGFKRLARLGYEYEITSSALEPTENVKNDDLNWNLRDPRSLLPNQVKLIQKYKDLLDSLDQQSEQIYIEICKVLQNDSCQKMLRSRKPNTVDFSKILKADTFKELSQFHNDYIAIDVECKGEYVDLGSLLFRLNDILPKCKGKNKCCDGYLLTAVPIDKLVFNFIESKPKGNGNKPKEAIEISDDSDSGNDKSSDKKPVKPEDLTLAQRLAAKRQARTRGDSRNDELTSDEFKTQAKFLEEFRQYINLCGVKSSNDNLIEMVLSGKKHYKYVDSRVANFYHCLNTWNNTHSESLLVNFKDNKHSQRRGNTSVEDILNATAVNVGSEESYSWDKVDQGRLKNYLDGLNKSNLHLDQIRWKIIHYVFSPCGSEGGTMITNSSVSKKAIDNLQTILFSLSSQIYKRAKKNLMDTAAVDVSFWNIIVSTFEILTDEYLGKKRAMDMKKYLDKAANSEHKEEVDQLSQRLNKWEELLSDLFTIQSSQLGESHIELTRLWLRFAWADCFLIQHRSGFKAKAASEKLARISKMARKVRINVLMINYNFIPRLSCPSVEMQQSKVSVLETFSNAQKSNMILEHILMGTKGEKADKYAPVEAEMRALVNRSSIELKLRLWTVLLDHYESEHDVKAYEVGFNQIIHILMQEIDFAVLSELSEEQQNERLLKVIAMFTHAIDNYTDMLGRNDWKVEETDEDLIVLESLLFFFKIAYTFLLYEDCAADVSYRKSLKEISAKSYQILMEMVLKTFTLISVYYNLTLTKESPENVNDFLSIMHVQLGLRHICNNYGGAFLQYIQKKLAEMSWEYSDSDFFQIIHCRYHIPVTLEFYQTFDHESTKSEMSKSDALEVSKYVVPYCYRKRHPYFNPPRNDIKSILDQAYETIGDLDMKNVVIADNNKLLTKFLNDTIIDVNLITDALQGTLAVQFKAGSWNTIKAAQTGLYFIQGLVALHTFKIRRRAMQGRSADLDFVIKMFQMDLISCSERFESWLLLGQAYSYLVEDDIIWTSDKLNNADKKYYTASVQKQAIICFLMAVNTYRSAVKQEKWKTDHEKEVIKPMVTLLWSSLGKELYSAWMKPMCKMAFKVKGSHTNLLGSSFPSSAMIKDSASTNALIEDTKIMSDSIAYKIISLVFAQNCVQDDTNWYGYMYLAKTELKLRDPTLLEEILENILLSCLLGLKAGSKEDPVVEPHYLLCSIVLKSACQGYLTMEDGIAILRSDTLFNGLIDDDIKDETSFYNCLIKLLRKCISYDKKKWQHKPRYLIAKIYEVLLNDQKSCMEEMNNIINLKSTVRSLSTIWKPENERPGKHFVYNFIYINYYIDLLDKAANVYPLITLIKKLRKLGSSMVFQVKTFDSAVSKACIMIKKIMHIAPDFLDLQIGLMVYSDFMKYSKEYVETFKNKTDFTPEDKLIFYFLDETYSFRKMANGFAATGVIDDCYHSLYLLKFMPYLQKRLAEEREKKLAEISSGSNQKIEFLAPTVGKSPSGVLREKIRVARRDITPFCVQIIKTLHPMLDELKMEAEKGNYLEYNKESIFQNRDYDTIRSLDDRSSWKSCLQIPDKSLTLESDSKKLSELEDEFGGYHLLSQEVLSSKYQVTMQLNINTSPEEKEEPQEVEPIQLETPSKDKAGFEIPSSPISVNSATSSDGEHHETNNALASIPSSQSSATHQTHLTEFFPHSEPDHPDLLKRSDTTLSADEFKPPVLKIRRLKMSRDLLDKLGATKTTEEKSETKDPTT